MKTPPASTQSERLPQGAGAATPTSPDRDHLCERIEERLAGLHRRLAANDDEGRKWLPGV